MDLAEIETLIAAHQAEIDAFVTPRLALIADLREQGIRTDEARKWGGVQAREWLMDRGATHAEATETIVTALRERFAAIKERRRVEGETL